MSHCINSDICEGKGDCILACPVDAITLVEDEKNAKGTRWSFIDPDICIDCGACLASCPVSGAISDTWSDKAQKRNSK